VPPGAGTPGRLDLVPQRLQQPGVGAPKLHHDLGTAGDHVRRARGHEAATDGRDRPASRVTRDGADFADQVRRAPQRIPADVHRGRPGVVRLTGEDARRPRDPDDRLDGRQRRPLRAQRGPLLDVQFEVGHHRRRRGPAGDPRIEGAEEIDERDAGGMHVDPEMLGKVFEELVTGRHETGSYYTPRPVVAFMCREALKGYLKTQVPDLGDEAVEKYVEDHDVTRIDRRQAGRILDALEMITVVDPACGSGAYLLGMMQELLTGRIRLV